ncbi:MAG TPA: hypothetical protein VM261_28750 [Kofleriaceae bacterium]|nr:hypothetical protein [Kofleriaceae bacterium]
MLRRILIALVVLASSCLPSSRPQDGAATTQLTRIDQMHAEWLSSNGPRQAVAYARAVHEAVLSGAYRAQPTRWEADLPASIAALDEASAGAGADAAQLVAWRAVLLADNAQPDEAFAELTRSLSIGPTYLAAAGLAAHHGQAGAIDAVHAVCAETAPRLADDERFDLMAVCQEASNALTEEAGLPWASAEELVWYRAERERRRQAEAAEADAAHKRTQDDVGTRRDQMMVGKMCRDECAETASRCYADCGSVAYKACSFGCESREKQCRRTCE